MGLSLTSTAFKEGAPIPVVYTCDGADHSPPLSWKGVPADAGALVLIADDPDAPGRTWVHWVLYDVPASLDGIPENVSKVEAPRELGGAVQGKNDFRKLGYGGPCPPPGRRTATSSSCTRSPRRSGSSPARPRGRSSRPWAADVLATAQVMGTYARLRR